MNEFLNLMFFFGVFGVILWLARARGGSHV